jgi:NADH:ubiquinone oxidoreductase subunit K
MEKQSDRVDFELKMFWRFRWFLVYLYAAALILSIAFATIIAIITRNVIPSIIPTSLLLAMKPIILWAFSNRLQKLDHQGSRKDEL